MQSLHLLSVFLVFVEVCQSYTFCVLSKVLYFVSAEELSLIGSGSKFDCKVFLWIV